MQQGKLLLQLSGCLAPQWSSGWSEAGSQEQGTQTLLCRPPQSLWQGVGAPGGAAVRCWQPWGCWLVRVLAHGF